MSSCGVALYTLKRYVHHATINGTSEQIPDMEGEKAFFFTPNCRTIQIAQLDESNVVKITTRD